MQRASHAQPGLLSTLRMVEVDKSPPASSSDTRGASAPAPRGKMSHARPSSAPNAPGSPLPVNALHKIDTATTGTVAAVSTGGKRRVSDAYAWTAPSNPPAAGEATARVGIAWRALRAAPHGRATSGA